MAHNIMLCAYNDHRDDGYATVLYVKPRLFNRFRAKPGFYTPATRPRGNFLEGTAANDTTAEEARKKRWSPFWQALWILVSGFLLGTPI